MMNVKTASRARQRSRRLSRRFWLLNGVLLLLYLWTLSESSPISITVEDGSCTAIVPGRSLSVPCDGAGAQVGLYTRPEDDPPLLDAGPLDWLVPGTSWTQIALYEGDQLRWSESFNGDLGGWQIVSGAPQVALGELHAASWSAPVPSAASPSRSALISRPVTTDNFRLDAHLRRAQESAAIVLLQPDGNQGLAFVVSAAGRRGTWWRWEDGLQEPLVGVPYQKPLLAQAQTLLRRLLAAHQGALLLLFAAWFLARVTHPLSPARKLLYSRRARKYAPILLALLAFALTLHIAVHVLQRIPHVQDSVTYLFQARTLVRGDLWAPAPPLPQAFEQEFLLVRDGRWFGKYPPGFPALLAIGVRLGAPWLVNPLLAALTVCLLFTLGKTLYDARLGLLAALLALVSPFFLFMSGSLMAHPAELFWMALLALTWLRALGLPGHSPRNRRLLAHAALAGPALGMTFLTRQYTAVFLGLPFMALALFLAWRRQPPAQTSAITGARPLLPRVLLAGATFLPFLLLLLGYQWALTGDPLQDPRLLYWEYDHIGFGQDIGEGYNAFDLTITEDGPAQLWFHDPTQPPRGHSPARGVYNVLQNWLALETNLYGWLPMFTVAFVWLAFLLHRPRAADWLLLLSAATLVGAYVFYWADGVSYGPRYFYAALPAFLLLTARGLQALARRFGPSAAALLLLLLVGGALIFNSRNYLDLYRGYNFVNRQSLTLVEQTVDPPALIFVDPGSNWWDYGSVFSANSPWLDGPYVFARDQGATANRALANRFPDRQIYLLQDNLLRPFPP